MHNVLTESSIRAFDDKEVFVTMNYKHEGEYLPLGLMTIDDAYIPMGITLGAFIKKDDKFIRDDYTSVVNEHKFDYRELVQSEFDVEEFILKLENLRD